MNTKTKTALVYGSAGLLVVAIYGASVYRVEQMRNAPSALASCTYAMCLSQYPSFAFR